MIYRCYACGVDSASVKLYRRITDEGIGTGFTPEPGDVVCSKCNGGNPGPRRLMVDPSTGYVLLEADMIMLKNKKIVEEWESLSD